MKVGLAIPHWGEDSTRLRNYIWNAQKMVDTFAWDSLYWLPPDGDWNRGKARNNLVKQAYDDGCMVLVICDADCHVTKTGIETAVLRALEGDLAFCFDRYIGLTQEGTENYKRGVTGPDDIYFECPGSLGGCLAVRPELWMRTGGQPEMEGWGYEDIITAVLWRWMNGPTTWAPGTIYHFWHPIRHIAADIDSTRNIGICKRFEAAESITEVSRLLTEYKDLFPWRDE